MNSPFNLDSDSSYNQWRQQKLASYPLAIEQLVTLIDDPVALAPDEIDSILECCEKTNIALYQCPNPVHREAVRAMANQLGLSQFDQNPGADDDGITSLRIGAGGEVSDYIPYSNQPLKWHTDGYYNPADKRIQGFLLHCVSPAGDGGENSLLDHEIAYLLLRDQDPQHIEALMAADAMTIPANEIDGTVVREESMGPVFFLNRNNRLAMRYTHRSRSVHWKDDPALTRARMALANILESSQYIFRTRLVPDQGIICNNVLHARTGFQDSGSQSRHFYRARFYDFIGENCAN